MKTGRPPKGPKFTDAYLRKKSDFDRFLTNKQFRENMMSELDEDLRKGLSADEIAKKYAPAMAVRAVTIAMTEADPSKALAAVKEVLDRGVGKATEKTEVTHKYQNLPDEELDAVLKTLQTEEEDVG